MLVDRLVCHDVQLAPVLEDPRDDLTCDRPAVDDEMDLLVGHAATVEDPGRVEDRQVELSPLLLPAVEDGLGQHVVQQPPEAGAAGAHQAREGGVGASAHGDVVRVPGDPVTPEAGDHVRPLLGEDLADPLAQLLGGDTGEPAVRIPEPLVPVGSASHRAPGRLALRLSDAAQGVSGGGEARPDVPRLASRGVDEDEPEVGVVRVQRDGPRPAEDFVIRVGDDDSEHASHAGSPWV